MRPLLLSLSLFCITFLAWSQSRTPDRIILTMDGDPATQMAVTWRTSTEVAQGLAQITKAEPGPKLAAEAKQVESTTTLLDLDSVVAHFHTVSFSDLSPATLYSYRVGDGKEWSEWFYFSTAASTDEPFSFIYFGDAQNEIKSLFSRVIRQAFAEAPKAAFMLHAGDLIDGRNLDKEWQEWHHAGGFVHGMIPSIPTPGNHEYYIPNQMERYLNPFWRPGFALPLNGPEGVEDLAETVYYIDYQGTRIISLNSMAALGYEELAIAQAEWLEQILANNPNNWTVVTFHHPVFSTARNRDNKPVREYFKPLFDKYGVDLVLQGHDHTYARGNNLSEGVTAQSGHTMYVVSVAGPKMYKQSEDAWWDKGAEDTQLYQVISVSKEKIVFRAYNAVGKLFDTFEIVNKEGKKEAVFFDK